MARPHPPSERNVAARRQLAQASRQVRKVHRAQEALGPRKFEVLFLEGEFRGLQDFGELRRGLDDLDAAAKPGRRVILYLREVTSIGPRQAALIGLFTLKRVSAGHVTQVVVRPGIVAAEVLPYFGLAATPKITWDEDHEELVITVAAEAAATAEGRDG